MKYRLTVILKEETATYMKVSFYVAWGPALSFQSTRDLLPGRKVLSRWIVSHKKNYRCSERKRKDSNNLWAGNLICFMTMFSLWHNSYQLIFMRIKRDSMQKPRTRQNHVGQYQFTNVSFFLLSLVWSALMVYSTDNPLRYWMQNLHICC